MREDIPAHLTEVWQSENKVGDDRRPVVRATIQHGYQRKWAYDTYDAQGGSYSHADDPHRVGTYTSMIFGNTYGIRELRNIKNCSWSRSVDQDVGTCTITMGNSDITPIGNPDENDRAGFDEPGFFTFSRGDQTISENRWGYEENGWHNVLVPDALVKTYEGYGINRDVVAAQDEHLVQTGVWLIDTVTYNADGTITLEMRDLGRMLLDQLAFPPVVPFSEYPMAFSHIHTENVVGRDVAGGKWTQLKGLAKARSSNDYYIGKGLTNGDTQYVDSRGGVYGHYAADALVNTGVWKDKKKTIPNHHYWQSTGQNHQDDFVWWEADLHDHTTALAGLRIQTRASAVIYVSLMGKNGWIGRKKIPYDVNRPGGVVTDKAGHPIDIEADIPFVMSVRAEPSEQFDVILPRKYADIKRIRLTYTWLFEASYGKPHSFHAMLRDCQIYTAKNVNQLSFKKGHILKTVGNYADYTNVVQQAVAWGGWWHPSSDTGDDWIRLQSGHTADGPGSRKYVHLRKQTKSLAKGGLWGSFMPASTYGLVDLTADLFDKKPLMDMVNYVRDLLGFNFFIDEVGAVIWRLPNIWSLGNWRWANPLEPRQLEESKFQHLRTDEIIELDENNSLFEYSTVLSSADLRERIFVANSTGKIGTVIEGYNPQPTGMRRMAGWTDQNFADKRECVVMADMVAARSMFTYRRGQAKIWGYPKIQIDDQIRIWERVTNETFYHYVMGISSNNDMENGTWEYDIDTHWLGERPEDAWVVDVNELHDETKRYLNLVKNGGEI